VQFSTPRSDGSTSDDLSVGFGFVVATGRDIDLQDQEEPTPQNETEIAGDQINTAPLLLCGTQVTLNVYYGYRSGFFSADCVRPAPGMADVFLERISSTLSSYSVTAPGIHRAAYTKDEADVPGYVTEAVKNKGPRANGPDFSVAKQKELFRGENRVPKYAPVMKGCFVLVFNKSDIDQEVYQARHGLLSFLDPLEQHAVHNSPNLRHDMSVDLVK
jgi:hypothetical protein